MATLKTQATQVVEETLTADLCFQKAAESLSNFGMGSSYEHAREWRTLGEVLLRGDSSASDQAYADSIDVSARIRTRNEVRAARGLPPIDGGDDFDAPALK